jgi:hypothetical protein
MLSLPIYKQLLLIVLQHATVLVDLLFSLWENMKKNNELKNNPLKWVKGNEN